jgi:hypothetical protein
MQAAPETSAPLEDSMALSVRPLHRLKAAQSASCGAASSLLRLAARERQASAAAPTWLAGLTRAMRAAGPAHGARPLHAVLAGGEFAPSEWLSGR